MDDGAPRPSSQGTYILAALWALVMLSAAVAPRLVPADGAAPGATATLAVLALLSLAALIAVWLLLQTLPRLRVLGGLARVLGILPAVLNILAVAWVWHLITV
ncbi:hypothetical protein [Lentisalinibacter orientalis]|jgi:hypothetical protein|uniref:hypothetical protein n=1 Tax=Lentisalinibacter orientalis TaxID=2992241 RepID=UPI003863D18F